MSLKEDLDQSQRLWDAHAELVDLKGDFVRLRADIERLVAQLQLADAVVSAARHHIAEEGIDRDDRALMDAIERYEQQRASGV